jgi:hypothetical protein
VIHLQKQFEIKSFLESCVSSNDLIACAFKDCPELQSFSVRKVNEYDDNNYSDYISLSKVNGHFVDYEGEYEEDEEDSDESLLPKITDKSIIYNLMDLVGNLKDYFDYGEDQDVRRPNVDGGKFKPVRLYKLDQARKKYVLAYLSGKTVPDSFFIKNDSRYAVFYALDHGRFSKEVEFKIFARKGCMSDAFEYAKHVLKAPLGEEIENFFLLSDSKEGDDHVFLQKYIEFKKSCLENSI